MGVMRDFSWSYFSKTGDVSAYLLYKDLEQLHFEVQEEMDTNETESVPSNL
jgi:hypothetical protein